MLILSFILAATLSVHADEKPLTDQQIVKVLLNLDEGEVQTARTGKAKAQSNQVKSFAQTMVKQHEKDLSATDALAKSQGITPAASSLSQELDDGWKSANADLIAKAKGPELDKAYMELQVSMHEKALSILDNALLPTVTNPDLKAHLQRVRVTVGQHLDHARMLQTAVR